MRVTRFGVLITAVGLWSAQLSAQTLQRPRCLHDGNETRVQANRREEAIDGVDLINRILERHPSGTTYPTWTELAKSPRITSLRGFAGPTGDLARKMAWGTEQPLPGWRVHYVAAQDGYAVSLTDLRDPCQLTFASNDTGVVIEGLPADRRGRVRVVPLDSSQ